MFNYLIRRLLLLPLTLFFILLVNFVIINLAPGDPVSVTEATQGGAARRADRSEAFGSDERYLQFRERYGLTLPILWNLWPTLSQAYVNETLHTLYTKKNEDGSEIPFKQLQELKTRFGDQSKYIMPKLNAALSDTSLDLPFRASIVRFFVRGGSKQVFLGSDLTDDQQKENKLFNEQNQLLWENMPNSFDSQEAIEKKIETLLTWYRQPAVSFEFELRDEQLISIFFFDTRFYKYFSRVLTLDFGTLRDDPNKTVITEVVRRFKYSLTLSIIPMLLTFVLCQILGMIMAVWQNRFPDYSLNVVCLILYAIPVFVVAPFLIEKVALNQTFPFTDVPIPISGFTSPDKAYASMTSLQRLFDVIKHILLPITAIIYGTLAAQSRLARTATLEVMRQDYVRTARAKGLAPMTILLKHVGRNAGITIITSIAASLGIILGGSLIVETLFEINGFGKFFYDAVVNRDYNVIMFSAIAGSFLTLLGYLMADIAYTILDPRVTLE